MPDVKPDSTPHLGNALRDWWREHQQAVGFWAASSLLARELWGFLRDSTPERRRSRYGDMDYDWDHHVNTTSGTVSWRTRLLGVFHSPYQPTDPAAFREMMAALPIDFRDFTFIDLGSGKGRTLLMASYYPFQKIIGVELLPELHEAAVANIAAKLQRSNHPVPIETLCLDAKDFAFPAAPLVLYLFNPLPEAGLRRVLANLEASWLTRPRPIWIVYHNPLMESILLESRRVVKEVVNETGPMQYAIFSLSSDKQV